MAVPAVAGEDGCGSWGLTDGRRLACRASQLGDSGLWQSGWWGLPQLHTERGCPSPPATAQ